MHFDATNPDPVSDTAHNAGFLVSVTVTPALDSDLSGGQCQRFELLAGISFPDIPQRPCWKTTP